MTSFSLVVRLLSAYRIGNRWKRKSTNETKPDTPQELMYQMQKKLCSIYNKKDLPEVNLQRAGRKGREEGEEKG